MATRSSWLPFAFPWQLAKSEVLGMNERNFRYISQMNRRSLYPYADNKVITKERAAAKGIPTPPLYQVVRFIGDLRSIDKILEPYGEFVLKPASGSGGNGVLVVKRDEDNLFYTVSGEELSFEMLRKHGSKVLHGLFSLGGQPDQLMIEYCVNFSEALSHLTFQGVPDFRLIVHQGTPVMAMARLPTSQSKGRANLHQGAVGVGIEIETGVTRGGVHLNRTIDHHPDTGAKLSGVQIPHWQEIVEIAASCREIADLGYLGVDLVLDEELGPLLLEINVRPGLAIQLANRVGLRSVLNS